MKIAVIVVRILMGLMLVVFGLNKFLHFIPMEMVDGPMKDFMMALIGTGFMMPIVAVIEIVTGLLFLSGKFNTLAATLLFPVMLNAFLAHLFLDPAGIGGSAVLLAMNIFMFYVHKDNFMSLVKA